MGGGGGVARKLSARKERGTNELVPKSKEHLGGERA